MSGKSKKNTMVQSYWDAEMQRYISIGK